MTFVCNVIFIVHWPLLMLRLCGQISKKNAVHLNYHKDAVLCSCVLPSMFLQGSLARLVSMRKQVRSLRSWNWVKAFTYSFKHRSAASGSFGCLLLLNCIQEGWTTILYYSATLVKSQYCRLLQLGHMRLLDNTNICRQFLIAERVIQNTLARIWTQENRQGKTMTRLGKLEQAP